MPHILRDQPRWRCERAALAQRLMSRPPILPTSCSKYAATATLRWSAEFADHITCRRNDIARFGSQSAQGYDPPGLGSRSRPLQRRMRSCIARSERSRAVTVVVSSPICAAGGRLKAAVEHPGAAELIEPGAVGNERR